MARKARKRFNTFEAKKIESDIEVHLFVCTYNRSSKNKSCSKQGSEIIFKYLKQRMKAVSSSYSKVVKVNSTSCLSNCANGPVVVSYPNRDWYSIHSKKDVDSLVMELERTWAEESKRRNVEAFA